MTVVVRSGGGLYSYERALARAGLTPVAGADEAGRGACAGPLVAAATILSDRKSRQIMGLRDSKLLTERAREGLYDEILDKAVAVAWVEVPPAECDALGMHVADITALRRAVLRLSTPPAFVITDGFPVLSSSLTGSPSTGSAWALWGCGRATRSQPAWRPPRSSPKSRGTGS